MGPKQTCNSMNKDTHKFYNDFLAQSDADIRRPKILDKKKIKEK